MRSKRGFQVFASFKVLVNENAANPQITQIVQRSDTVVKKMGIEDEVRESRIRRAREKEQQQGNVNGKESK